MPPQKLEDVFSVWPVPRGYIMWRVSPMRELLKREASKQKKNECLEVVPRWRAQQGKE
jgi:hypothetical protein